MAITVQTGTVAAVKGSSLTIPLPASVTAGDLLLVIVTNLNAARTISVSGWSNIHTSTSSDGEQINIFQKTATGSDSDPVATTGGFTESVIGVCVGLTSADTTTGASQITALRSKTTTSSIDPPAAGAVKIAAYYTFSLATGTTTWTSATKFADYWLTPASGCYLTAAYRVEDTAAAMAFSTSTSGDTGATVILSVALGAPAAPAFVAQTIIIT